MTSIIENSVLVGRYRVEQMLGQGAQGKTWLATDSASGVKVVIKELLLSQAEDWKSVELFEREGAALRAISHPGVPRYIESMHLDDGGLDGRDSRFLIVQEFVDGKNLQHRIDGGRLMDEGEIREFLRQVGEVLEYLHGLSPAVIHRDIKPSNIVCSMDNGKYSLIDFGAVQAVQSDEIGGSTVVGSSGYLAAEQLIGRAVPGSDLYALAATAVHLASGVEPWKLPVVQMRMQYRDRVRLSADLMDVLDSMLEPSIGLRIASASELLAALERLANGPQSAVQHFMDDSEYLSTLRAPTSDSLPMVVVGVAWVGLILMSPFIIVFPAAMTLGAVVMLALVPAMEFGMTESWQMAGLMLGLIGVLSVYWVMIGRMLRDFWRSSRRPK